MLFGPTGSRVEPIFGGTTETQKVERRSSVNTQIRTLAAPSQVQALVMLEHYRGA